MSDKNTLIGYSREIMSEIPGLDKVISESRLREIIIDAPPIETNRSRLLIWIDDEIALEKTHLKDNNVSYHASERIFNLNLIRKLLQGQPEIDKELNDIIKVLYTTEKLQLTSCDITKLANRLEAIEKLLQSRQPERVTVTIEEAMTYIDTLFHRNEEYFTQCCKMVVDLLKPKGIKVEK